MIHPLISVSHAEQHIREHLSTLGSVKLLSEQAGNFVLAQNIVADRDLPPYDRVMMDGICYHSSLKTEHHLEIKGTLSAGDEPFSQLAQNQAWRINTGAAIPRDCDTVTPVENLEFNEQANITRIVDSTTEQPGQFIHAKGSDVSEGEILLSQGTVLNSLRLSAAASVGITKIDVIQKPRVFLLTTGQEVISPDQSPTSFQIRQSHYHGLTTALQSLGYPQITHRHLPDDYDAIRSQLENALSGEYDAVITCGAISRGTSDYLRPILQELIGDPVFHGVAQRPGKPFAFWGGSIPVFALPGNALSTLVTVHRYVIPALQHMAGISTKSPNQLEIDLSRIPPFHLTRFLPAARSSQNRATLFAPQNSGDFSNALGSDGFIELPAGDEMPALASFYPWY